MTIKRYKFFLTGLEDSPDGDLMQYDDHAKAMAEKDAERQKEIDGLWNELIETQHKLVTQTGKMLKSENEKTKAEAVLAEYADEGNWNMEIDERGRKEGVWCDEEGNFGYEPAQAYFKEKEA